MISLLFMIFIVFPIEKNIYELQKKIELTKIKIENGKRALLHKKILKKQVAVQGTLINYIKKMFVGKSEQPMVYKLINSLTAKNSLTTIALKPQPDKISEKFSLGPEISYKIMPLIINVRGGYKNIANFISDLSRSEKYFTLEEINIKKENNKSAKNLKAKIKINEYLLVESNE